MARPSLDDIFTDHRPSLDSIFAGKDQVSPLPSRAFRKLKELVTGAGKEIVGFGEGVANAATNFTTGALSQAVSGLSGLNTFLGLNPSEPGLDLEAAKRVTEESLNRLSPLTTYTPQTKSGGEHAAILSRPFEEWSKGSHAVGEKVTEMTGSPTLGAIAGVGLETAPITVPFVKGMMRERAIKPKTVAEPVRPPLDEIFKEPEKADVAAQEHYRVVPADTPLGEIQDHWTTTNLQDAARIKRSLEESNGLPQQIVKIDSKAVADAGGKSQGKSPYGTNADWVKTNTTVTPDAVVGVMDSGGDMRTKVMNRIDGILPETSPSGHPQTKQHIADVINAEEIPGGKFSVADIDNAGRNIKANGVPQTDIERALVRVLSDDVRSNRHKYQVQAKPVENKPTLAEIFAEPEKPLHQVTPPRPDYQGILAALEGNQYVRKGKSKQFYSESDFKTLLKEQYPSVADSPEYTKSATLSALRNISQGKPLTDIQQRVIERFDVDHIGNMNRNMKDVDTLDLQPGDTVVKPRMKDGEMDTFKVLSNDGERLVLKDGDIETHPVDFGTTIQAAEVVKGEQPSTKRLYDGEQGEMFATPPTFGKKAQGKGAVEENPMFTEMKERQAARGQGTMFDEGGYNIPEPPRSTGFDNMEVKPLEMPEIVELAREMMEGRLPQVMQKLRSSRALGLFRTGTGEINLKADIFKTPGLAERVLAHEIGHLADWLPDRTMARGNILGRLASLKKYMKATIEEYAGAPGTLTPKDRTRIRKLAEQELKANEMPEREIIEQVTREIPKYKYIGITPEMVKQIWTDINSRENYPKLYEAIARMSGAEKASVMKEAMKGLVAEQLKKFGERVQVGTETVTETIKRVIPEVKATPEQIAKRYRELIAEEIGKRNLYTREQVMKELKDLTLHWKPFTPGADQFTKYRFSGEELYADALSVLLNDPALLRKMAPTFEKAFFSYMDRKPAAQDVYYELQQRLRNPQTVQDTRLDNIYEMFRKGHEARQDAVQRAALPPEGIKDTLSRWLIDREHAKLKTIRKGEKLGGEISKRAKQARQDIEEVPYIAAEADNYLKTTEDVTTNVLQANGLTVDDMGAYMMARHIIENRADIANVGGHSAQTATMLLDTLRQRLGDNKFAVLQKAADDYRQVRERLIIPRVEASGIVTTELLQVMKDRTAYAKVSVQKFLEDTYGAGVTSKIYKQIGTLQDIENPFVATVLQDMSLLRAAKLNESKRSTIAHLIDFGAAQPAEMRYSLDVKGRVPVDPKDPRQAVLTYMVNGKPQNVYVSKVIADSFTHSPFEATKIWQIWATLQQPIRDILVSKNPLWMARNVIRDFRQTIKNNPEVKLRNTLTLAGYYKAAFGEVWRDVMKGERSADIARMKQDRMLVPNRVYEAREMNFENELQRLAAEFDHAAAVEAPQASSTVKTFLKRAYNYLDRLGRVSEVSGKLAGYKYLKDKTNLSEMDIAHRVRTRIGTPDYKRQGEFQQITNNIFLFSNVNKEGIRSAYEAFRQDKAGYVWKTIATNIMPKLIVMGAAATVPEWKEYFDKIPNYDKRQYTIIPIGYSEQGKAIYARLPEDYEGQFFGALVWDIAHGKITGKDSAIGLIASQSPYRLHPLIQIGADVFQYYVNGINPVDEFRGRTVIPETAFKAGGADANKAMGKHVWRNLGGSIVYEPTFNEFTPPKSVPEKVLKTFPLNTLGTFIKISDQGLSEKLMEVRGDIREKQAQRTLEVQKRISDSIERGDNAPAVVRLYREMKKDGLVKGNFPAFKRIYDQYKGHTSTDPHKRAMSYARSKEEKKALMGH